MKLITTLIAVLMLTSISVNAQARMQPPEGCALVRSVNPDGSLDLYPSYWDVFPQREGKTFCCIVSCSSEEFYLHYKNSMFYLCKKQADGSYVTTGRTEFHDFVLAPRKCGDGLSSSL